MSENLKKKTLSHRFFFFNEIWLKLGDHEYIDNSEIGVSQFYSGAFLEAI